jgi:TPR repeat protein
VTKDTAQALIWLGHVANLGHEEAQYELGNLFCAGNGVKADRIEAMRWWLKAAKKWHLKAQIIVRDAFARGDGVERSEVEEEKWSKRIMDLERVPKGYAIRENLKD